jgi:hypothetical protein
MLPVLDEALALLVLGSYVAAWWFALWLLLGRPRQPAVLILFGVAFLGFGVPLLLADVAATNPQVPQVLPYFWAALPIPVLGGYALCRWFRPRVRR